MTQIKAVESSTAKKATYQSAIKNTVLQLGLDVIFKLNK